MNHLVHHDPVAPKIILVEIAPQQHANGSTTIAPGGPAANARTIDRHQQQPQRLDGKVAVIGRDGPGRRFDPVQNLALGKAISPGANPT